MRRLDKEIIGKEVHGYAPFMNKIIFRGSGNINKKRVWKKYKMCCYEKDFNKLNFEEYKGGMYKGVKITLTYEKYDYIKNGKMINYEKHSITKKGTFSDLKELKAIMNKIKKEENVINDFEEYRIELKNRVISYFRKTSIEKISFYHKSDKKQSINLIKYIPYKP